MTEKSKLSQTLAVLNKIEHSLIDVQEPSKLLSQIAKDAKNILGADIVDLYEYNQGHKEFVLPPILEGKRRTIPKYKINDDDVVVKVVKAGKPQYFPDAQNAKILTGKFDIPRTDTPDERFVIRENVVSSVSLPLKAGEETVGVMFVNYRTHQDFDKEQKYLVESFSNLAAIAIHNARLWKVQEETTKLRESSIKERNRQLDAIKEIIDVIGISTKPTQVILEQAVKLFEADYGNIGLSIPASRELIFDVHWKDGSCLIGDEVPPDKKRSSWDDGITGYVARTGKFRCEADISTVSDYMVWYPDSKSELTVPIIGSNDKVIGVLDLESKKYNAFNHDDINLCQRLARMVALAIEKSEQFVSIVNLNKQLEYLHQVISEQDLGTVLDHILQSVIHLMGEGTSSSINLYDAALDEFTNILAKGELKEHLRVHPRPDGTARYVLKKKKPLYIEDITNPPDGIPTLRSGANDLGIRSFAAIPLMRNSFLGVFFIHHKNPNNFSADTRQMLETFASQVAVALENSRLYSELQEVVNQSAVPTFVIDAQNIVTHWNKACEVLTGIQRKDVIGTNKPWKAFYKKERAVLANLVVRGAPEEEIEKLYEGRWQRSKLTEGAYEFQTRFRSFGGGPDKWLFFTAAPLRDANGNIIGAIETLQDTTEQKQAEIENTELYAKLRALLSAIPDLVIVYDKRGYYVDVAQTSPPQYLYKPSSEMIGKTVHEVLPEQQADICLAAIQESLRDNKTVRVEYGLTIKGRKTWFDARVSPMTDETVIFVARDITERKEAEDKLQEMYKHRTDDIVALQEINNAVASQPEQVLDLIVQKAVNVMSAEFACLWLTDSKSGDLLLKAFQGPLEEIQLPSENRLLANEPSDNMKVFQTGKPLILADVEKESKSFKRIYQPTRSELIVPMKYLDQNIGTLNVESRFPGTFNTENATLLESFASQAVIAINNSKIFDQRTKDIAASQEINSAISQKPLPEIYNLIAQKAKELTQAAYSTLWILDAENKRLKVGSVCGRKAVEDSLPLNDQSFNGYVAMTREAYICSDTGQDNHYHPWYADICSNLTVPIIFGKQLIGTLHVESTQRDAYNENQEKLLRSLADQAAIAIENSKLFEQQELAYAQLEQANFQLDKKIGNLNAVIEMGKQLTASVDLSEMQILNLIYKKLDPLMETENMYIALYDHATDKVRFPLMFIDGKATEVPARKAGAGRTEHIIDTKESIFIATRDESIAWYKQTGREEYIDEPFTSWIGVPMISGDQVIGVIATYHKTDDYVYDHDDLEILLAIANQAAIALEVTRRIAELKALQGLTDDLSTGLL